MANNDNGANFLMIILWLYVIISQFMTFYFWYQWAQDHSFWSTFIAGFFVSEFKGILWIFFIW